MITRKFVWALGIACACALLSSCALPFSVQPVTPAQPVQVVSANATTRTLKHVFGESVVPLAPQRVLAIGEDAVLVNLLDLGLKPVASNVNVPERVPLVQPSELSGVQLFASAAEFSLEKLSAFKPDLIIGTRFFIETAGYDKLSAIAPTVALGGADELEAFVELARVLGKEAEAQKQVNAFKQQLQDEAKRIGAAGRKLSVGTVYPGPNLAAWVGGPSPIPKMLLDMGFALSPDATAAEPFGIKSGRAFISPEKLDVFAADTMVLLQSASVEGELDAVDKIKTNPLWAKLPAVQANRVFTLDRIGYPGFRGAKQLLADVVKAVEK